MMALADVFEALSSNKRPYKGTKKLSEVLQIMCYMVKDHHIDKDIFELFIESKVYLIYAKEHLSFEQIDIENCNKVLNNFLKKE